MNKTTFPYRRSALAVAAAAAVLAACGGSDDDSAAGGGGGGTPTDPVVAGTDIPSSATTSSMAAFAFVNGLASKTDDMAEPLVVGDVTLASSDTDEPDAGV